MGNTWHFFPFYDTRSLWEQKHRTMSVEVNSNGQITDLILSGQMFRGTMPDFQKIVTLKTLSMTSNMWEGSIPDFSFNTALEILDLSAIADHKKTGSKLTGTLPDFSKNTALRYLNIADNLCTGPVPDFSSNTALETIWLNSNEL